LEKLVDKGYLNQDKDKNRNVYTVLSAAKPKSFLFSVRRDAESPEQLVKVVSDTVRNSRTEQHLGEDTHTFVDPLKGYQITVRQKEEQDEVTIGAQVYLYPSPTPAQCGSSEPSKETVSESEKKANPFLLDEKRTENSGEVTANVESENSSTKLDMTSDTLHKEIHAATPGDTLFAPGATCSECLNFQCSSCVYPNPRMIFPTAVYSATCRSFARKTVGINLDSSEEADSIG
jgi:hypothetical protein